MTKRILLMTMIVGICAVGSEANDAAIFERYQAIVQQETDAPVAIGKAKRYLVSLSHEDFMRFIRETGLHAEYAIENADSVVVMAIFANWFKEGPGRDEFLLLDLKQLSDATLPPSWKIGLLDVLNLENRDSLTEEELSTTISVLSDMGQTKPAPDVFRAVALQKLGSVLYTQRELATLKTPDLKDALEKQDRSYLPKRDDATVRQAAKLIDAIRDYKVVLQKTADEVKDEQIKANLKKRLTKWDSVSVMPTK